MRAVVLALAIFALAAVMCGPAFAAVDLLKGSAEQGDVQIGVYSPDSYGSMDGVREFDGRSFDPASLEHLELLGYSGPWQYRVLGRYLFAHDADTAVGLNYMNRFGLSYKTSTLTHRLEARRAGNIALVAAAAGTDLSPGTDFNIVRRVDDVNLRFMDSSQSLRLVVGSWQQSKDGTAQFLGRWNTGSGNIKHVIALPVDTNTSQSTVGTDIRIGAAVINYRFTDTKYGQNTTAIATNSAPKHPTEVDSDTTTSTVKARAAISDRLYFTGVHTTRQRTNTHATSAGLHPSMSISATNAALTYLATDSLTLTARYRMTDQDSHVMPTISSGTVTNNALSTTLNSSSIEASFSGIRHAFLKAGYEHRDITRSTQLTADDYAEIDPSSKADIVTGSFRYYPTSNLSISANGLINNTDYAGYAGAPNKKKQLNANATYMLRDNMALFADYSSVDERNDLIRIPLADIPATGEDPRKDAAGQGYNNQMKTSTIGTWYSVNSKLVWDANYSKINTDASNLWILGLDASTAASNTVPNMVSFSTQNNQWSTGLTYSMSSRLSFYGRYIVSNSDGQGLLDTTYYPPGVGPTWLPVSLRQHTYVVGFAHNLTDRDRVMLDFSVSEYVDLLNSANTGAYDVWRVAWSRGF